MFFRFNHCLTSDRYCATVDDTLSEDIESLNGFNYVSDSVTNCSI